MFSVRVAKRVPELSNVRIFVPVFAFESLAGDDPDVGGHIGCVALTNSRTKTPFCEGVICSCQIYRGQLRLRSRPRDLPLTCKVSVGLIAIV